MDPLTQLLLQRQMNQPPPQVITPSGGTTHTPTAAKRFATAQAMMNSIRNGWNPNPVLQEVISHGQ